MLNWRPVYEIEMRELESKKRSQRLEIEIERLKQTNKQLAVIEPVHACLSAQCQAVIPSNF